MSSDVRSEVEHLALARFSFAFLLDEVTHGVGELRGLDALLAAAINQANIAPLTRDFAARARYGQLEAPAPDEERRPVSINAIAASLGIPFETARRRVRRLSDAGACAITSEGVVIPASFLTSPAYLRSVGASHERLRQFYFELRSAGLVGELPPSAFPSDGGVPVRAAARLLSDYVLRAAEGLMRESPNVISALVLLALLSAALGESPPSGFLSINGVARRLDIPAETVRRHVAELEEEGLCARAAGGLAMPADVLTRAGIALLLADNAVNVQRLLAGLAERGVVRAWEAQAQS